MKHQHFGFILVFSLSVSISLAAFSSKRTSDDLNNPPPRRRGFLWQRITGDGSPYTFPVQDIPFQFNWSKIDSPGNENGTPFTSYDFSRLDPYNDFLFYALPRPVYHIDEPAVCALTQFYRREIPINSDILDLCSSWVSHFPLEFSETMNSITGLGMNWVELALNDQLDSFQVQDLNAGSTPVLPYSDNSFDVVTCACSFDYLTRPIEILRECRRVLRPGGKIIISFSNRCFGLKAVRVWRTNKSPKHPELLNGYCRFAGGFRETKAYNITPKLPRDRYQDPMYVFTARC